MVEEVWGATISYYVLNNAAIPSPSAIKDIIKINSMEMMMTLRVQMKSLKTRIMMYVTAVVFFVTLHACYGYLESL